MLSVSKSVLVQLVQINQPYLQQDYLPYVAGLLQAYVQRHALNPVRYTFLQPLFQRLPLQTSVSAAALAEIVAFSTYVWNWEYSLKLAQLLKQQRPERLIIFGGPQVPDRAEAFLRQAPWVDVAVHGEGEQVFLDLLEAWPGRDWEKIAGISYLDDRQRFRHQPRATRMRELERIPSPYLTGIFAPLLAHKPGPHWIALWETNRGCPFSCSFCDWGSATASKVNRFDFERLLQEIQWFARQQIHTVYCCDANYGLLKRDLELTEAMVQARQQHQAPQVFYIQNTKNVTDRAYEIQKKISTSGLNPAVTLSLQSVNPAVLKHIQRENISLDSYRELQQRFRADGVQTYTDMLVGLPGDSFETFVSGVNQVISEGQHHLIRFYNVYLLPNAEMAQPAYRQQHGLQTVVTPYAEPFALTQNEITEYQEMVIATATLPRPDWCRIRALAWWAELFYFNSKLLQLPWALLQVCADISLGETLTYYLEGDYPQTEVTASIQDFLLRKAQSVQAGEVELCAMQMPGQGEVWLSVELYILYGLTQTGGWTDFFHDQRQILASLLQRAQRLELLPVFHDALRVSEALFLAQVQGQGQGQAQPFSLQVDSNFWEVYQAHLQGQHIPLQAIPTRCYRDWTGAPYDRLKTQPATAADLVN